MARGHHQPALLQTHGDRVRQDAVGFGGGVVADGVLLRFPDRGAEAGSHEVVREWKNGPNNGAND